jgi:hypothetical protein
MLWTKGRRIMRHYIGHGKLIKRNIKYNCITFVSGHCASLLPGKHVTRTIRTAECVGTNDPETEGKCNSLSPYLVMAVSSNEMFELADNNNLYLEACKVQSSIGLWQSSKLSRLDCRERKQGGNEVHRESPRMLDLSALI